MDDFTLSTLTAVNAGAKAPAKSAKTALAVLAHWAGDWPRRGRAAKDALVSDADAHADALWLAAVAARDARLACIAPHTAPLCEAVANRDRAAAVRALEVLTRAGAMAAETERRTREAARPMLAASIVPALPPTTATTATTKSNGKTNANA